MKVSRIFWRKRRTPGGQSEGKMGGGYRVHFPFASSDKRFLLLRGVSQSRTEREEQPRFYTGLAQSGNNGDLY